jgi:hypothetical protein
MGAPLDKAKVASTRDVDAADVDSRIGAMAAEAALALGLIRVLTLLRFHDPALDEIEQHVATIWESLLDLRRVLDEASMCRRPGGQSR